MACDVIGYSIVGPNCTLCDSSCLTCSGTLATNCLSCPSYPATYLLSSNHSCVTCNVDRYVISGSQCLPCHSSCLTCSDASETGCLTCPPLKYYVASNHSCVSCNVDHYYILGTECLPCDSSCLTCTGNLPTNCLSCPSSSAAAYLLSSNNSCVQCNVVGYSIVGTQCIFCYPTCLTCSGSLPTNCLSCPTDTYLLTSNHSCVACDVDGYTISDSECLPCHSSCQTCFNPSATGCFTCPPSKYFVASNHSCVSCNVNHYYISGTECLECDENCLTCSGSSSTDCLSCPLGKYFQPITKSCVICDVSACLTCYGPLPTNCLSCLSGTYLLSSNDSCVECDVDGYSISGIQCVKCDPSCLTCNGPTATSCLTCPSGSYYLSLNHSCVNCEEDGFIISDNDCLPCDSTCLTCNGTSPTSCLSCPSGRYFQNFTCLTPDPIVSALNNSAAEAGKLTGAAMQAQSVVTSVLPAVTGGLSTSAVLLVGFLSDVDIYKYINVPFPDNFVTFCNQMSASALPNVFISMDVNEGNNPNSTIGKFKFWGLSATLLDNSSAAIFKELFVLGIIVAVNLLLLILKRYPSLSQKLHTIRRLLMWNLFLSYYLGDFSELQLNSMVQMRENYVSSAYANLSLAFAVLIVASYLPLFVYLMYQLNKRPKKALNTQRRNIHLDAVSNDQVTQQWAEVPPSIGIIVEDFHSKNRFTRSFMFIMLSVTFIQILIVFFFQESGLFQAFLYTLVAIVFTFLTAWQRPYKSRLQMVILLVNLISKLIFGLLAIIFGINERTESISLTSANNLGFVLVILILFVIGVNLVISVVLMVIPFWKAIKEWRAKRLKKASRVQKKRADISYKLQNLMLDQSQSKAEDVSLDLNPSPVAQAFGQIRNNPLNGVKTSPIATTLQSSLFLNEQDGIPYECRIVSRKMQRKRPQQKAGFDIRGNRIKIPSASEISVINLESLNKQEESVECKEQNVSEL